MPRRKNNLWVHLVFTTKERQPLISPRIAPRLHEFLCDQLLKLDCYVDAINGTEDHVHISFRSNLTMSLSAIVKQIKGSSSRWINKNDLIQGKFRWQRGYGIFPVNGDEHEKLAAYINNQFLIHARRTMRKNEE